MIPKENYEEYGVDCFLIEAIFLNTDVIDIRWLK